MAKTVTTLFEDSWKKKYGQDLLVSVYYKRRYWTGAAYAYESAWTEIKPAARCGRGGGIVKISKASWKLDTPFLNVFKASNITLQMPNIRNEWLPDNDTGGFFRSDLTATSGYEPFLTKFQVRVGYKLSDGTTELVSIFTGLAVDFIFATNRGYVEIVVSGNERLLQAADAGNVSTAFTTESCSPATGDGSNKTFYTTSKGVGRISQVRVNSAAMTQGSDYSISNLAEYDTAATITFVDAPVAGQTVDATGIKWKADQVIETLVGLLCDEAGIVAGERTIQAVIFPGGVSGSKEINSEAEWAAGTVKANVTETYVSGDLYQCWHIIDDFDDDDYSSDPTWALMNPYGQAYDFDTPGKLRARGWYPGYPSFQCRGGLETQFSYATGTKQFKVNCSTVAPGSANSKDGGRIIFMAVDSLGTLAQVHGYALSFEANIDGGSNSGVRLERLDGTIGARGTTLAECGAIPSGEHTWAVSRTAEGSFTVYKDGAEVGSAVDTTYSSCAYFAISSQGTNTNWSVTMLVDEISYCPNPSAAAEVLVAYASPIYESEAFDLLAAPTAWGTLLHSEVLNGGSVAFYTATSDDGVSWDAYVAIGGDGTIQSTLRRYLKVKATFTNNGSYSAPEGPAIRWIKANFTQTTVYVSLANFNGQTCWQAVQTLAKIANYEVGFDGDGKFFFRTKTPSGSPVVELDQSRGIAQITQFRLGYDLLINNSQVTYNGYFDKWDSSDAAEAAPTSQQRFGTILSSENMSDFLLANDANLAGAMARARFEANYLPMKRFKMKTKIIPHLDLGDIVQVSYYDDPKDKDNIFGDPLRKFGDAPMGLPENVLARSLLCKVTAIDFDPESRTCDLEVQEILS